MRRRCGAAPATRGGGRHVACTDDAQFRCIAQSSRAQRRIECTIGSDGVRRMRIDQLSRIGGGVAAQLTVRDAVPKRRVG